MTEETTSMGKILVVDDERPIGELLTDWLSEDGYAIEYAEGFDGVRDLMSKQSFDLVTLDIMMPGMDGLGVLHWLRRHHPDVSVVMATALDDLDTVLEAMRLGALGYLVKPLNLELVSEEVGRVMQRRRLEAENLRFEAELEERVATQTRQLRQTYSALEEKVRLLEARDRMVRIQMTEWGDHDPFDEAAAALRDGLSATCVEIWCPHIDCESLVRQAAAGPEAAPADPSTLAMNSCDPVARVFETGEPILNEQGGAVPLFRHDELLGVLRLRVARPAETRDILSLTREAALLIWSRRVADELEHAEVDRIDELMALE